MTDKGMIDKLAQDIYNAKIQIHYLDFVLTKPIQDEDEPSQFQKLAEMLVKEGWTKNAT